MPNIGENWTCPYCCHAQVLSAERHCSSFHEQCISGWKEQEMNPVIALSSIICANSKCAQLTLKVLLGTTPSKTNKISFSHLNSWLLLPASAAKPQSDFIPAPLRADYYEACSIRDLSPKASATLIRRCLQGMIRDFCKISRKRLIDEIMDLRKAVDSGQAPRGVQADSLDAIDHFRGIGNIGAHMEADINLIVDVDANEAQVLIELVELLFDEWYVAREDRKVRLEKLKKLASAKKDLKKPGTGMTDESSEAGHANR